MEELLKKQNEIIKGIESRYAEENYTESNPLIVLNPFDTCPLSALMKFQTEEECSVTIFIEEDIEKEFK
ncbi:MAG: aryl-sulfate sulfotransferase N-terminal domain-containing protein, partial [Clostridium paraputrificum]